MRIDQIHHTRRQNIDLARWFIGSHKGTVKCLAGTGITWTVLSEFAVGRRIVTDHEARIFEQALGFPSGWLDRDNKLLLKVNVSGYGLALQAQKVPPESAAAALTLLNAISDLATRETT